jgi:hypothetical protein
VFEINGFDRMEAAIYITPEDLNAFNLPVGHQRMIYGALQRASKA